MGLDKQMRDLSQRILKQQGLNFLFEHSVTSAKVTSKGNVKIEAKDKTGKTIALDSDILLVAVGRKPYTEGLGLENVGIKTNKRGRIEVNPETLATTASNIYAIGDVIEGAMLAHRAEEEGVMIAENLAGKYGHVNYAAVPWIVYTWPEIAWVGRGAEELTAAGIEFNTGRYMFKPNGRAKAMNETEGTG